jgi:hypothetical protein
MNDNQSQTIDQVAKIDFIQELLKLGNRENRAQFQIQQEQMGIYS